jgi:uncharacterized membrane protein YGL010W
MLGELYQSSIRVLIFVHTLHEEENMNKRVVITFFVCLPICLRNSECILIKFALRLYAIILLAHFILVRMSVHRLPLLTDGLCYNKMNKM